MDLIDRYLAAVRRHLPRKAPDDIIQELSDSLRSEAEEREHAAGHALTEDEQAELLKKHGHPWVMATRYAPQRYLIGPELFPYYRQTLIVVLFWVVVPITFVTGIVSEYSSGLITRVIVHMISAAWNGAIFSIGIVTSVFYVLERERVRINALANWDPRRLPEYRDGRAIPRSETIPGLIFTVLFLLWWIGAVRIPYFVWQDGEPVQFVAGSIWGIVYTPVLLVMIASVIVSVIDVVRPWRTLWMSAVDVAINGAAVVVLVYMLRLRPQFVEVAGNAVNADHITRLARLINGGLTWGAVVLTAVIVLDMLYELWLVVRSRSSAASAVSI
jgi:hypothetical protein